MAIINEVKEVLHRIRVKLYPNYLPKIEGAYIARTNNEAFLSIQEVCAALKNRGGYTGNYDDLVEGVSQFFDEAAYQLCNGFGVNTGYFSIHPNVGGTFNSVNEAHNREKHPVSFRFRSRSRLRRLAENIRVEIEGLADVNGWIDEFIDVETGEVNGEASPQGQFVIHGHKIKIEGEHPDVGVYLESTQDNNERVKVTANLAENTSSKVIGIIPPLAASSSHKVVILTQTTGGGQLLKDPREISSSFTVFIE